MGSKKKSPASWFEQHQYSFLLGTLLIVYTIYPFVGTRPLFLASLQLAVLMMMGAAVSSFWHNRIAFVIAVVLGIAVQVSQVIHRFTDIPTEGNLATALEVFFYIVIIHAIAGRLFRAEKVTMNAVFGVCSIYLLMAFAWANVYVIMEKVHPGSFKRPEVTAELKQDYAEADNDLLYFSLITMTTVGYGDITPVTPPARTISALQGIIGQLFLATILARIVSMEIGDRMAAKQTRQQKRSSSGSGSG